MTKAACVATLAFALAGLGLGQTKSAQPPAGVTAEWDVQHLLDALVKESKRLEPVIAQSNPQQWKDASAAQNYAAQWKSAQNLIQYFAYSADQLSKQPERLTLVIETYFRMEAMDATLNSFADGIRRYQNPAVAELLHGIMNENASNRDKLKQYLTDLAASKEQEFLVADREAQRCRNQITRQPATSKNRRP